MAKRKRLNLGILTLFLLVIFMSFLFGFYIGYNSAPVKVIEKEATQKRFVEIEQNIIEMKVPAVDRDGNGILADLIVKVRRGDGLILVNINDVLADLDTQHSARKAAEVASEYTGISLENLDVVYEIETDSQIISGTSAGAAMSIATILALENREAKDFITMTGIINSDGSISQVAGILAKAKAAKEEGLEIFLVPLEQSQGIIYRKEESCRGTQNFRFCTINYVPEKIDIGKEVDLTIVEVSDIYEALSYFK